MPSTNNQEVAFERGLADYRRGVRRNPYHRAPFTGPMTPDEAECADAWDLGQDAGYAMQGEAAQ